MRSGAQVGARNFIEPLITQDPNPSNELALEPNWVAMANGQNVVFDFSLEKRLADDFSLQLASGWTDPMCRAGAVCNNLGTSRRNRSRHRRPGKRGLTGDQTEAGFGDLELLVKYAIFKSDRHETRIAIGMDSYYPTGDPRAGAGTHSYLGPILMLAKGMGDLGDSGVVRYLRPFAVQGDFTYLMKAGGTQVDVMGADADLSYEFYYLADDGAPIPRWAAALTPFAELNWDQVVQARYGGTQPSLRLMPGIAWMTPQWQTSLAAIVPLNRATVPNYHQGVFAMLSLTLDQIFPQFGWQPL